MGMTSEQSQGSLWTELTVSAEARRANGLVARLRSTESGLSCPCGLTCCGSSMLAARPGWLWNSQKVDNPSSFRPHWTFNALVTGAAHELLTANTGCPNGAPAGFSSEEWASAGWPYGITYTLTASEWKEGNYVREHMRKAKERNRSVGLTNRAAFSMGHVPTVCEAEFLQGFPLGALHSWALEMQSRFPWLSGWLAGSRKQSETSSQPR